MRRDVEMINFLLNGTAMCDELKPVIKILHSVVTLIQWGVPFLLIIFGMLDLGKAVMAGKEDEMKKAQNTLLKRVIYAVAVFLVVSIVSLVMTLVSESVEDVKKDDWFDCWSTV